MSRGANFFALPTDDQVNTLAKASGQGNAATALGLPSSQPSTPRNNTQMNFMSPPPVTNNEQPTGNLFGNNNYNSSANINTNNNNNNNISNDALQQMMSLLQGLMNTNSQSRPIPHQQQQQQRPGASSLTTAAPISNTQTNDTLFNTTKGSKPVIPPPGSTITHYEYPSPIGDMIYIGGASDARNKTRLKTINIQFVINLCSGSIPNFFPTEFIYKDLSITDDQLKVMDKYSEFKSFVDQCINSGMKVLIHDESGIWKSSALVIAYICELYSWSLKESYDFCKGRRREIKLPPRVLVALGNWEISTIGTSSLAEIVLSEKQKGQFAKNNGDVLQDKTLQGFLSNRQARAIFDDYEEQISGLNVQYRNVYSQYLQLKIDIAKLELEQTLGKPNLPIAYDMDLYVEKAQIEPYVEFERSLLSVLQEYNAVFTLLKEELNAQKLSKNEISSNNDNNTNISDNGTCELLPAMGQTYTNVVNYINNHLPQLISITNNNINVAIDDGSGKNIPPDYPIISTLTNTGYLSLHLHPTPLRAETAKKSSKKNSPIQSPQDIDNYQVCLFCAHITQTQSPHSIIDMKCQCGDSRNNLVNDFKVLYQQQHALGGKGADKNNKDNKNNKKNDKSDNNNIPSLISMNFQSLYLLSAAYPSLFSPNCAYTLQSLSTTPTTSSKNNKNDKKTTPPSTPQTEDTILQIIDSLTKLNKSIENDLMTKLPNKGKNKKQVTLDIPSNIDPALIQLTTQATNDLSIMVNTFYDIFSSFQFMYQLQTKNNNISLTKQRFFHLFSIYTLIPTFNSLTTVYQTQLLALQTQWNSNSSGDTAVIEGLKVQVQDGQDEIIALKTQLNSKDDELASLKSQITTEVDAKKKIQGDMVVLEGEKVKVEEELLELKKQQKVSETKLSEEKKQVEVRLVQVEDELNNLKKSLENDDEEMRKTQIAVQQAQVAKLQQVSTDDDALQSETLRQVIAILQSQKIWLGMQLGLIKSQQLKQFYITSLTQEQLQVQLQGTPPESFIRVLDVTADSVASKCGVRNDDVIVSFNGALISTVKQIHSIATDITPGDRIAIAVLRPDNDKKDSYTPLVLNMETRSRLLDSKQLQLLRSLHRGETRSTPQLLAQVMELKALCDHDAAVGSAGGPTVFTRRSSIPDLALMRTLSANPSSPKE